MKIGSLFDGLLGNTSAPLPVYNSTVYADLEEAVRDRLLSPQQAAEIMKGRMQARAYNPGHNVGLGNAYVPQAAQNAAQASPPKPSPTLPLKWKTEKQIHTCVLALPHRVLQEIHSITFELPEMAYVVHFTGSTSETFDDIEHFPSDADIARILLMCP